MDATGTASMAAAAGFVWSALRFGLKRVDDDLQARAAARQRAAWARWEQHPTCMRPRSAGGCLGLTTHEEAAVSPHLTPAPAPVPVEVESVPDYVPEYVIGQVVRDLIHERGVS